ncbi:MAG: alanine racemase [Fluviibacter sp.]
MNPISDPCSPRPIIAEFSGKALIHNVHRARALAPSGGKVFAVIKADAYGHGLAEVAKRIAPQVDGFAILELSAAQWLRAQGFKQPIVMLEGFFSPDELVLFSQLGLSAVVHRADQIEALANADLAEPIDVVLKMNTGMNRLGIALDDAKAAYNRLTSLKSVRSVTLMTHFADADNARGTDWQLDRLTQVWPDVFALPLCFANSAALLIGDRERNRLGDAVRPGIMLYGASPWGAQEPSKTAEALDLLPVMTLKSSIIAIQHLAAGERVGYGGTFVAERPMRIGVVACGYADGYPRHAGNLAPILVNGQRSRVLGRVSMDMLCCDLTDAPDADVGSPVTLWGAGLPADEVADAAGTIAYELFCALAARVPRVWKD